MRKTLLSILGFSMVMVAGLQAAPKIVQAPGYKFGAGSTTVTLNPMTIGNSSAENATGTIRVDLMACSAPYAGTGAAKAHVLASFKLEGLEAGRQYANLSKTVKTTMPARRGTYYLTFAVAELRGSGYVISAYRNYPKPVTLGPSSLFTMTGPWSWTIDREAGTAQMKVAKISHSRSGTTGSLKLSLWATTKNGFSNKAGGTYYELASVSKKALQRGYVFTDVENVGKYKAPPRGTYYIWLVLLESDGTTYKTMATLAASKTATF